MKAWGRRLPTTDDTQKVPKLFWIGGRGPVTCAVHVDVDDYDPIAVDNFRLSDVAAAAEDVIAQCLIPKGKVGLAYPAGPDGYVHAKVRKEMWKRGPDFTCQSLGLFYMCFSSSSLLGVKSPELRG